MMIKKITLRASARGVFYLSRLGEGDDLRNGRRGGESGLTKGAAAESKALVRAQPPEPQTECCQQNARQRGGQPESQAAVSPQGGKQ